MGKGGQIEIARDVHVAVTVDHADLDEATRTNLALQFRKHGEHHAIGWAAALQITGHDG